MTTTYIGQTISSSKSFSIDCMSDLSLVEDFCWDGGWRVPTSGCDGWCLDFLDEMLDDPSACKVRLCPRGCVCAVGDIRRLSADTLFTGVSPFHTIPAKGSGKLSYSSEESYSWTTGSISGANGAAGWEWPTVLVLFKLSRASQSTPAKGSGKASYSSSLSEWDMKGVV